MLHGWSGLYLGTSGGFATLIVTAKKLILQKIYHFKNLPTLTRRNGIRYLTGTYLSGQASKTQKKMDLSWLIIKSSHSLVNWDNMSSYITLLSHLIVLWHQSPVAHCLCFTGFVVVVFLFFLFLCFFFFSNSMWFCNFKWKANKYNI